jgi:hypothetical protein
MSVRVGDWSMPWNARDGVGRLGPGIPKSDFWASAPEGIDQVGCVYTAQGFEFDYVGVIVGPDLVYRPMDGGWVGQRDQSHDRVVRRGVTEAEFTRFVKSTYRFSPLSSRDIVDTFGRLEQVPDVVCTGGWWPRGQANRVSEPCRLPRGGRSRNHGGTAFVLR